MKYRKHSIETFKFLPVDKLIEIFIEKLIENSLRAFSLRIF